MEEIEEPPKYLKIQPDTYLTETVIYVLWPRWCNGSTEDCGSSSSGSKGSVRLVVW